MSLDKAPFPGVVLGQLDPLFGREYFHRTPDAALSSKRHI
jgi:hypothetical protein